MKDEKKIIYDEVCEQFRSQLREITNTVALNACNRSYNALIDVVANVILLEINLGRKAWDAIPKTKVRLPKREDLIKDSVWMDNEVDIATILLGKVKDSISYQYTDAESFSPHTIASMGLYSALKTYLKDHGKYNN